MNVKLGDHLVGDNQPCYIVAEMSASHCQSFDKAIEIVRQAAEAGADAIKLQTYKPESLTIDCDKSYFHIKGHPVWEGQTLYDLYKDAYMPWEWHEPLFTEAQKLGIGCFSTPFDLEGVEFLKQFNMPAVKIASFEAVDYELIEGIAQLQIPVIMSTGMCSENEIEDALNLCRKQGIEEIVLLKCVSSYPAPYSDMNLACIPEYQQRFSVIPGLSDHSLGHVCAVTALTLGAKVIEKHFILDYKDPSPDASFSMDPKDFKTMVQMVRHAEEAIGKVQYGPGQAEQFCLENRRSLFAIENIKAGQSIKANMVKAIRPGHGLHPKYLKQVLSMKSKVDIERGEPIKAEDLNGTLND